MTIKEKNLKLIMELIFIFILPLAFLLPNIKINNEYVYDDSGNFASSEKIISYDSIVYNQYYKNYIDFNQLIDQDLYYSVREINGITFTYDNGALNIDGTATDYADFIFGVFQGNNDYYLGISGNSSIEVRFNGYNGNYEYIIDNVGESQMYIRIYPNQVVDNITIYPMLINLSQAFGDNYIPTYSDFKTYFPNDFYFYTLSDLIEINDSTIISSDYTLVNSALSNVKELISKVLLIDNSNITFNIVIDYTCIWFVMFIIWHLLYLLFDFIIHLAGKFVPKKE